MSDSLTLLARGRNAELYALDEERVLKLFRPGFPAAAAGEEFRNARLARELGVPTPRAERMVDVEGRAGIVLEHVRGPTLLQLVMAGADSPQRLAGVLFELQAAVQRCDASRLGASVERLRRRIAQAAGVSDEARRRAVEALERLPGGAALCHGDFHPGNVIVTRDGPCVIDWLDAGRGSAAMDSARSLLVLELAPVPRLSPEVRAAFVAAYRERLSAAGQLAAAASWQLALAVARLAEPLGAAEREALLQRIEKLVR